MIGAHRPLDRAKPGSPTVRRAARLTSRRYCTVRVASTARPAPQARPPLPAHRTRNVRAESKSDIGSGHGGRDSRASTAGIPAHASGTLQHPGASQDVLTTALIEPRHWLLQRDAVPYSHDSIRVHPHVHHAVSYLNLYG